MDVLIVTADSMLGASIARHLRKQSCVVDITTSQEVAKRMLTAQPYGAVFIDPESIDGAAHLVERARKAPSAPLVVVLRAQDVGVGSDSEGVVALARSAEADEVARVIRLHRPISP